MKASQVIAAANKLEQLAQRMRETAKAETPREKQARTRAINAVAKHARYLYEANAKKSSKQT